MQRCRIPQRRGRSGFPSADGEAWVAAWCRRGSNVQGSVRGPGSALVRHVRNLRSRSRQDLMSLPLPLDATSTNVVDGLPVAGPARQVYADVDSTAVRCITRCGGRRTMRLRYRYAGVAGNDQPGVTMGSVLTTIVQVVGSGGA